MRTSRLWTTEEVLNQSKSESSVISCRDQGYGFQVSGEQKNTVLILLTKLHITEHTTQPIH